MRVQILKDFVKQHFPATPLLDYALEVEKITTSKVSEGCISYFQRFVLFCFAFETRASGVQIAIEVTIHRGYRPSSTPCSNRSL